jgi:hypothetical protein
MNPRHQAEAGNGDPTQTVQLDDTYRLRIVCRSESGDSAHLALCSLPPLTVPPHKQCLQAELALNAALAEFKIAAAAVIDRIKAGEHLPKLELDTEWNARHQLLEARQLVDRLANRRKAFAPEK